MRGKIKNLVKLIMLAVASMIFFAPTQYVKAVPDINQTPTLSWQQTPTYSSYSPALTDSDIYYVMEDKTLGYPDYQWRIEKRDLTTGALVTGFGTNGVVTENPSSGYDAPTQIISDLTAIYIVGTDSALGSSNYQWRIEKRDLTTGALVTGFGTNGVVTVDPSSGYDTIYSRLAIDGSGLYIAGQDDGSIGNDQWRIEKRDLTTGALVTGFGTNGVVTVNPSAANYEYPNDILVLGSHLYIVGNDRATTGSNYQWRIEKRDLTTGALVTGFGTNGVITVNPSGLDDGVNAVIAYDNSLYIVGDDRIPGNDQWRIEKRDLTTGALVTGFGTSGVFTYNPSANNYENVGQIAADASGLYITARDCSLGEDKRRDFIQKRDFISGNLIENFGSAGILELDYNAGASNFIDSFALDSSGLYFSRIISNVGLYKYAFPEDSTPPALGNLPGLTTPINLTNGQVVSTNPYVINVKPDDNIDVAYVEFYVDNVLICTDTTADSNGVYSCDWDTSKYHSDIKVIAYDTTGNQSVALERSVTVNLGDTLPNTGTNAWIYLLGLLPAVSILVLRRKHLDI